MAQFCEAIYPVFRYVVVNWLECTEEAVSSAAFHSWGCSGDAHVSGSVCAQWGVSRGARGGGPSPGAFLQGGLGYQHGDMLSLLWSELFSCRAEGKGKALPVGRADGCACLMLGTRQTFSPPSRACPFAFPLQDKQAVLGAVAAMMGVLLREEQHREHAWEQLPWLLHQYHWVLDTSWVSKVRCCAGPGMAAGVGLCECHEVLRRCEVPGEVEKPLEEEEGEQGRPGAFRALWEREMGGGGGAHGEGGAGGRVISRGSSSQEGRHCPLPGALCAGRALP